MKNVLLPFAFSFLLPAVIYAQVCTGGYLPNGMLWYGNPTMNDNDVNNAIDFSSIWATGELADFYVETDGLLSLPTPPFTTIVPTPATGNYLSCWISKNAGNDREGFMGEFPATLAQNNAWTRGVYDFSFDAACLGIGTTGDVEVAVYGVYNPNGTLAAAPSGQNSPNSDFFGASNTTLLYTFTVTGGCNAQKSNHSFQIHTNTLPPSGISHFMITRSDANLPGARYMAFDNFCLSTPPCPQITSITPITAGANPTLQVTVSTSGPIFFDSPAISPNPLHATVNGPNYITYFGSSLPNALSYSTEDAYGNTCKLSTSITMGKVANPDHTTHAASNAGNGYSSDVSVAPNPANNTIQVSWDTKAVPKEISISIFNTSGIEIQRLERVNGYEGTMQFDLENLASGLYFIKVQGANYTPAPIKFVKQN